MINHIAETLRLVRGTSPDRWKDCVAAAYEALQNLAPRDELEGMLAVQMIATHNAVIECLNRCMIDGQPIESRDYNFKHATKLMALYERQLAAWDRRREQAVRHISVKACKAPDESSGRIRKEEMSGQAALTAKPGEEASPVLNGVDDKQMVKKEQVGSS